MIVFTVLIHLVFLASVFDIYFKSPVVSSSQQFTPEYVAPARRIVLFVADGLRADSLFSLSETETPYFRKIIQDLGSWGVSHTKVPTESRPGHVALIAGMFEDPSAITRGWRENPVDFDTFFNQSRYTWSWGSPDILPMFSKGASRDENNQVKVFTEMYDSSFEDFSANDLSQLDTWVFDKVEKFFERAANDHNLQLKLRQDKLVFFLHLLGCDTNGHTNKPGSKELLHNIKVLDKKVKATVDLIEKYWRRDSRTSYIFTSDHGMTDWGSHGAGLDHETQTPILAWGAGIQQPVKIVDSSDESWPLVQGLKRRDVNQTDVSTLMAALLGVAMPKNSMGKLPIDYLKVHESHIIQAKFANVLQIHEQFLAHQRHFTEAPLSLFLHRPFPDLTADTFEVMRSKIVRLESKARYRDALRLLDSLHGLCTEGLNYYQRYHRFLLYVTTTFSYIGFVLYVIIILAKNYSPFIVPLDKAPTSKTRTFLVCLFTFTTALVVAYGQNAPWHYAIYYTCPVVVAQFITLELSTFKILTVSTYACKNFVLFLMLCFFIVELLVLSFFDRRLLSVAILVVCLRQIWTCRQHEKVLNAAWIGFCLMASIFTFLPTVGKEANVNTVVASGVLTAICLQGMTQIFIRPVVGSNRKVSLFPFHVCLAYLIISTGCVLAVHVLQQSQFKSTTQTVAWVVMLTALTVALLTEPLLLPRLLSICSGLQSMYLLLSLTHEGFFLIALIGMLFVWLVSEHKKCFAYQSWMLISMAETRERRVLVKDDIWRSLLFLFFSVISFFGTGNLASINSFDPKSIRTLVSVFNPFLMGGLLLFKVLIPFLVVACFLCAVRQVSQMPSRALFLLLLLFSDLMGLHFFFLVTDKGSWLEIGTSLSHFIITEATVIFLQLFYLLAKHLMKAECLVGQKTTSHSDKDFD